MSSATRLMARLIFITVPTIQYGGYFLLTSLMDFWRRANAAVLTEASMLSIYLGCMAVLPDDSLNKFTG